MGEQRDDHLPYFLPHAGVLVGAHVHVQEIIEVHCVQLGYWKRAHALAAELLQLLEGYLLQPEGRDHLE